MYLHQNQNLMACNFESEQNMISKALVMQIQIVSTKYSLATVTLSKSEVVTTMIQNGIV